MLKEKGKRNAAQRVEGDEAKCCWRMKPSATPPLPLLCSTVRHADMMQPRLVSPHTVEEKQQSYIMYIHNVTGNCSHGTSEGTGEVNKQLTYPPHGQDAKDDDVVCWCSIIGADACAVYR